MAQYLIKHWGSGLVMATAIATIPFIPVVPSLPGVAAEHTLRILTVTGQGTESLPTTLAVVSLGIDVSGPTAADVQAQMAQRSSTLVEFLQTQSIDQLETTGIRLDPRYDYRDDQQRLIGYRASNTVQFEISVDQAGEILDDAVKAGATRIDNIRFRATDEAIAIAQRQALQAATRDAQDQADTVLASLGLTRQDIVGIQINHAQAPAVPMPQFAARAVESFDVSTPVIASDQEVSATVTLQIQY